MDPVLRRYRMHTTILAPMLALKNSSDIDIQAYDLIIKFVIPAKAGIPLIAN
jgi:hypothetical protein